MNKYKQENARKIKDAFDRLKKNEQKVVESGLFALLNAALGYLDEAHETMHEGKAHRHPEEQNTLGWALVKNKQIVEAVSHAGGTWTPHGDALGTLTDLVTSMPDGWCGVVLSDMSNHWYRWDWEEDFLEYSLSNIRADGVLEYFKPVGR